MELQKENDLQQEVVPKRYDLDSGLELDINPNVLKNLSIPITQTIKEESIDNVSEIETAESHFNTNLLDLDQLNGVEKELAEPVLNFATEDLLPNIIIENEILALIREE